MTLLFKMILSLLFIFIGICLFASYLILPLATDVGATLASCLSAGATIYTAFVAYFLLDNWKIQHRANLKSDYFKKNFNNYIDLKNTVYVLQNTYDSFLEDIGRHNIQPEHDEDHGLIRKVTDAKIKLNKLENSFNYYAIIFKDETYAKTIEDFKEKLDKLLDPTLEEYHEREGQVSHSEHFNDAKNLKEQLPIIMEQYDKSLSRLMANNILLH